MITPGILRVYHRLPPRLRSTAATLRGWYLNRVRHSADRETLMRETIERDRWSAAQWENWRSERRAYVLHRAATRVPFYRDQWAARRARGDRSSWELLENWPLLDKDAVRTKPHAFLADDCDPARMYVEHTSGTTGTPITAWFSRTTLAMLHAIVDVRTRGWDGIEETMRWARLGAQLIIPIGQRRPPFWVWNAAMRQLYLSTYHLAPDLIPHYLDALVKYRIGYIAGYPSALHAVAHEAVRLGRTLPMAAVYTNAEPLSADQRRLISAAFQCSARETYGMAEAVAGASECSAGGLHQWPEFGDIEIREDGEFVCTSLLNADNPLIRYRVGDRGQKPQSGACPCGRSLPLLGPIDGRPGNRVRLREGDRGQEHRGWVANLPPVPVSERERGSATGRGGAPGRWLEALGSAGAAFTDRPGGPRSPDRENRSRGGLCARAREHDRDALAGAHGSHPRADRVGRRSPPHDQRQIARGGLAALSRTARRSTCGSGRGGGRNS